MTQSSMIPAPTQPIQESTAEASSSGIELLGKEVNNWQAMLPGMAFRAEEVANRFLERVQSRNLPDTTIRQTELSSGLMTAKRPYWLVEKALGTGSRATIAVRFENSSTQDLIIEWRHFEQNVLMTGTRWLAKGAGLYLGIGVLGAGLLTSIFGFGLFLIPIGIWIIWSSTRKKQGSDLVGDQNKDSWMLEQTVDAALREAIDLVGISKDLIREVPKGQRII